METPGLQPEHGADWEREQSRGRPLRTQVNRQFSAPKGIKLVAAYPQRHRPRARVPTGPFFDL